MEILQVTNKYPINNTHDRYSFLEIAMLPENLNMSKDTIQPTTASENPSVDDKLYHQDYLSSLIISIFAFFILGYYLYYISKSNLKRVKYMYTESSALIAKFSNIKKLAYACFCILKLTYISQGN